MMNWTGGRLSRHSRNAGGPLTARQKQHFAKVRANNPNSATKNSRLKLAIFDNIADADRQQQRKSKSGSAEARASSGGEDKSRRSQLQHNRRLLNSHRGQNETSKCQSPSFITQSIPKIKHFLSPDKVCRVPDDDYYNATPPLKNKRRLGASLSDEGRKYAQDEEAVVQKRRRLLRGGDWVGISIQRPLLLAFASSRNDENVGRRRTVTADHRARYGTKIQSTITSPFVTRNQRQPVVNSAQVYSGQGPQLAEPAKQGVRISIGGREVSLVASSSPAQNKTLVHLSHSHLHEQGYSSSDVMLLDDEDMLKGEPPNTTKNNIACIGEQEVAPPSSSNIGQETYKSWFENDSRQELDISSKGKHRNEPRQIDTLESRTRHKNSGGDTSNSLVYLKSMNKLQRFASSSPTVLQPQNEIMFSSSSTSVQHPVPRSSRISRLLHSASPEEGDSTAGRVGQINPIVPSSQVSDNEMWNTWMLPAEGREYSQGIYYQNERMVSISPGISTHRASRNLSSHISSDKTNVSFGQESKDMFDDVGYEKTAPKRLENCIKPTTQVFFRDVPRTRDEIGLDTLSTVMTEPVPPSGPRRVKLAAQDNNERKISNEQSPDDVWQKFVFGSNRDEVEDAKGQPESIPSQRDSTRNQGNFASSKVEQTSAMDIHNSSVCGENQRTAGQFAPSPASNVTQSSANILWGGFSKDAIHSSPSLRSSGNMSGAEGISRSTPPKPSLASSNSQSTLVSSIALAKSEPEGSSSGDTLSSAQSEKRIIFTRPRPFCGRKTNINSSCAAQRPLHIGRRLAVNWEHPVHGRKRERDVYSLVDSDELDPIEDD